MYDKVTDKYEQQGTAIYYMSLPAEEHALAIMNMRDEGDLIIKNIDIDTTLSNEFIQNNDLRKILDVYSPHIHSVKFDVLYRQSLDIQTVVDYRQRTISITIDPQIREEDRTLLADYFKKLMDYTEVEKSADSSYEWFKQKFQFACKTVVCASLMLIPTLGVFALIIGFLGLVLSTPKVTELVYRYITDKGER